jgi:hypothetical protein
MRAGVRWSGIRASQASLDGVARTTGTKMVVPNIFHLVRMFLDYPMFRMRPMMIFARGILVRKG